MLKNEKLAAFLTSGVCFHKHCGFNGSKTKYNDLDLRSTTAPAMPVLGCDGPTTDCTVRNSFGKLITSFKIAQEGTAFAVASQ